jgi:uncharacterized protein YdaT
MEIVMPWTESDYPNSMKNLSPERRRKAISIANAILREGGDEGIAIATAIKRTKGSSIIKLASEYDYHEESKILDPIIKKNRIRLVKMLLNITAKQNPV